MLLAKTQGAAVLDIVIINSLVIANQVLENTMGNQSYRFASAAIDGEGMPQVITVNCPSTASGLSALSCAKAQLSDDRNTYAADIVLMALTDITNDIAIADPDHVNADNIEHANNEFAYVVADASSFAVEARGRRNVAHELGHILYLEHKSDAPGKQNTPVSDNHAFVDGIINPDLTIMGALNDCIACLPRGTWHPFFSSPGLSFTGGETAGNTTTANSKDVITDHSWSVVAGYRDPVPVANNCNIQFDFCSEGFPQTLATAFWPGQSMTHVDLDYQPLGSSSWYPIYDGNPSCAAYNTPNDPSIVRAIVANVLGQVTSCSVTIGADLCGDGGFF